MNGDRASRLTTLALVIARRELRGGLRGFRVFLACLALGVAAIAGVGSVERAIDEGLRADARSLLGGDIDLSLVHREASPEQLEYLESDARLSRTAELRAMARGVAADNRQLVELKAVDDAYPLFGQVELAGGGSLAAALEQRDGRHGAVADPAVLETLGLAVGSQILVGESVFVVRDTILREPDRSTRLFSFGPRLMVSAAALDETGLVQPGSLVNYHYRLDLPDGIAIGEWRKALKDTFPDAGWQIRDARDASPGLRSFIDRLGVYLTLVGLTALLVGGIGVAGAVRNYLEGKVETIATLKCLGAPNRLIFMAYMAQVVMLSVGGIAVGLAIGAAMPALLATVLAEKLPVTARAGLYAEPLVLATAYGLLTSIAFSVWPLARVRDIPAGALFRNLVAPADGGPRPRDVAVTAGLGLLLVALVVATARDPWLAMWFSAGSVGALVIFRAAAAGIARLSVRLGGSRGLTHGRPGLRLALSNLHRPGAPTTSVVLSLGIGVTVLIAVALVEGNLSRQVNERLPQGAPTFFFIDIQSQQVEDFDRLVGSFDGADGVERVPSLRGRISAIDGVAVEQATVDPEARWAVRNERGLTYAADPPDGATIVAGSWWPADYDGPPLISFDAELAAGMGLDIGDTMTVNVLGREVTATIANLRRIDWTTLAINFTIVFAPGTLEGAPQTHIATARVPPDREAALLRAVTDAFPNVSAIRVKDALEAVNAVLANIGDALRVIAAVALLAGALVLAGAVTAGHRRRVYDAVVMKVLGARKRDVLRAFLLEYGLLGAASAAIAAVLGILVSWLVVTQVMETDWTLLPRAVVLTALGCVAVTLLFGYAGVWRALERKAAPLLRNE